MAHERARVRSPVIRNWRSSVRCYHVGVEIHQALPSDGRRCSSHAMSRVANRTAESVLNRVQTVLRETGVGKNLCQIVALRAHGERARDTRVGIGKEIRYGSAGNG